MEGILKVVSASLDFCLLPPDCHPVLVFIHVLKMSEALNNVCAPVWVLHSVVIVCSRTLFSCRAGLKQPALKTTFLMSHAF